MTRSDSNDAFESKQPHMNSFVDNLATDDDMLMEHILENINKTPIGQVLKKIASLPEIRQEKVLDVRSRINQGDYDLNERLDMALEKVLDDFTEKF